VRSYLDNMIFLAALLDVLCVWCVLVWWCCGGEAVGERFCCCHRFLVIDGV
jgi:hypothetical protein